jgi:DNA modification methylase
MELYNNDCLEVMKDLSSNSIDLLFCDLPYGQTNCKWDTKIDLDLFWKQVNRICKINCPMFFTTTSRFGVDLINSNPKNFRYDLVWVKTHNCGFLNAKKMPMRKHEMIYVFYRKLPLYNLSSHSHKFLGIFNTDNKAENCYGNSNYQPLELKKYDPPLPNSVIRNTTDYTNNSELYGKIDRPDFMRKNNESVYDPPLPNSVIKEEKCYGEGSHNYEYKGEARESNVYDPPLPTSVITTKLRQDASGLYGNEPKKIFIYVDGKLKNSEPRYDPPLPVSVIKTDLVSNTLSYRNKAGQYDPPLPVSVIKDEEFCNYDVNKNCYGGGKANRIKISKNKEDHSVKYDPPLPDSVIQVKGKNKEIKEDVYNADERFINGKLYHYPRQLQKGDDSIYDPPLPNSLLEIKSQKGKHSTQKPTELMKWILKYYSKEGDVVLDPTMGSGSTGIACKEMNRKFIGIEKDEKIFKSAVERLN